MRSSLAIDATDWDIPMEWRAPHGAVTPDGHAAQFRSAAHALMAARIQYLRCNPELATEEIDDVVARYQNAWTVLTNYCQDVVAVVAHVENRDLFAAASRWNSVCQPAVNDAYTVVLGEAEPVTGPNGREANLSHVASEALLPNSPVIKGAPDRALTDKDRNDAWDRAEGICLSCGTVTTRTSQHQKLRRIFRSNTGGFNLTPTYVNTKMVEMPLWSERILIAAKGSPDHVIAASRGGLTTADNLANVCAACQFARSNRTHDDLSIPIYGTG